MNQFPKVGYGNQPMRKFTAALSLVFTQLQTDRILLLKNKQKQKWKPIILHRI